ncbi:MAG: hypothetical protein K9N46_17295 [Candidatus Marinimicrobia bacterium]|nr:hypothetical protein [Candidatus Neomarinimicrobiota bacterium]MCF7830116.1 hypothetical protein [Candidatus Neomarinimicrobiota bacterium]MCF7882485.1 hypothetical protein [Candidatus Neomarinimicrobiota bacterium]
MAESSVSDRSSETTTAIIVIRIFALFIILAGMALVVVPIVIGERNTLTLYAYLFSGIGLVVVGYGLLQLYIWGMYLLLGADAIAIVSLIITYRTLPFFKSLFIILGLLLAGYFILNRDLLKRSDKI